MPTARATSSSATAVRPSLTANQRVGDMRRAKLQWDTSKGFDTQNFDQDSLEPTPAPQRMVDAIATLNPMEIQTFLVDF